MCDILEYLLNIFVYKIHTFVVLLLLRSVNISPCTKPFAPTAPKAMKPTMSLRKEIFSRTFIKIISGWEGFSGNFKHISTSCCKFNNTIYRPACILYYYKTALVVQVVQDCFTLTIYYVLKLKKKNYQEERISQFNLNYNVYFLFTQRKFRIRFIF